MKPIFLDFETQSVRKFDLDGKTYQIVDRIPVLVAKLPRKPARKRAAK